MARTEWTDAEKSTALAVLDASPSVAAAAQVLRRQGLAIPENTLYRWSGNPSYRDEPGLDRLRQEKREELASIMERLARKLLDDMLEMAPGSIQQNAIAFGIVTDKMLLLRGEANNITQDATSDEDRARRVLEVLARTTSKPRPE